jgi:lysophospholipase L1-like esterase
MRIMPLGDSITLGVNGGYRNELWTDLTGESCGVNYVGSQSDPYCKAPDHDHEGHPGFTIGDIASNVDAWLAAATPDYILLMIGTNDIAWWSADDAVTIGTRHLALMDQIMADRPNAKLIVASIPPITSAIIQPNNVDRAQLGRDLNVQIQANVATRAAQGKPVYFADVYSVLTTADLYDGVHPTEAAHARVGDMWFSVLAPLVSCSAPAPACGP